jgi:glycosyltransferase involved in cell wall biosynthesis
MDLSVLVIQMGARRGYEYARMLEARDSLVRLQTSAAWVDGDHPSGLFRRFSRIGDGIIARRTVRGIPPRKVRTTFLPELVGSVLTRFNFGDEVKYRIEDSLLGASARAAGVSGVSIVLNTAGNGGIRYLEWAKRRGCRIASDIVISPTFYEVLAKERAKWPGWEPPRRFDNDAERYRRHMEKLVSISDMLISPSDTVDDGLATLKGFDARKLVRVPYGLGAAEIRRGHPEPRRVLFAGQAALRKGLPYLAEAARILKPLGYDIRVAGHASRTVKERTECSSLTFLGYLDPKQMAREFYRTDIFCLPSLAEGMASVTLEALACGVPCVVTRSAGAPVRDGHDGRIVAEGDGIATACAIRAIAEDRVLRDRMSEAALQTAAQHSLQAIGDRLQMALANLVSRDG